jgi:hypothetical protein
MNTSFSLRTKYDVLSKIPSVVIDTRNNWIIKDATFVLSAKYNK